MNVWRAIPEADRRQLGDFLRLITDNRIVADIVNEFDDIYACAVPVRGTTWFISFDAYMLRHKSSAFLRYVVAHELEHVFCQHYKAVTQKNERQADKQAVAWVYPEPQ